MSNTTTIPQEPSSCSTSPFPYHVFLSRGEDTRWTFSDHLHAALVGAGFRTLTHDKDDDVERGYDHENNKSIKSSIVVFSKDYVCSEKCLDELVMVLQRRRSFSKHVVLPVFYDLDPSLVRKQTGTVAEAFGEHEGRFGAERDEWKRTYGLEKMEKWRAALGEVADLAGLVLQNQADGHESKFIKIIIKEIAIKLDRTVLSVTPYPTGIDSRVKDINLWLQDGSNNIGIMVIYGMGGIGKTTIAKFAYNQNFDRFEGSSFVANIRETSEQPNGLVRVQKQLLSNILKRKKGKIHNVDEGIVKIKNAMCCKRVLLVLDDVDELDQLNAIIGMRDWFHPGSKIIITTRQERMLKAQEGYEMYKVKELNDVEALCLFSRHAFGQDYPIEAFSEQSKRAVNYCSGLPLALEVLGCSLSCESVDVWESALAKLGAFSNVKIQNVLQISYDCLDDHDSDLFLDIVCFFVGKDKDFMVRVLDGCDFHTTVGIQNLIRRCLVAVSEVDNNTIMMHQLIREMGKDVIRQESPKEPGKRSRVWHHRDAFNVLEEKNGTETIEGLIVDLQARKEDIRVKNYNLPPEQRHLAHLLCERRSSSKSRGLGLFSWLPNNSASREPFAESDTADLKTDAFSRMHRLRILQLYDVKLNGGFDEFPKKLRWLCWRGYHLTSIPEDFPLENMVVLDLTYSNLKQFWKGTKVLKLLKILNLTRSYSLASSPDFSKLPNLEKLFLKDCTNLVDVHESIVELRRLVVLNLKNCKSLRKLPRKICQINSLEKLVLSGCLKLDELPNDLQKMESLKEFQADGLNMLSSRPEVSLASLPSFVVFLSLADCNLSDDTFPKDLSGMVLLKGLRLSRNPFRNLPESIKDLSGLMELDLERCTKLQELPELPMSLQALSIYGCKSLERAKNLPNLLDSLILSTPECAKLVQVQGLFKLEPIERIDSEMSNNLGLAQLESRRNFEMKLYNNLTYTSRKVQALQGLHECGIYSIFLPGIAVPGWFSIKSIGTSITFNVPSLSKPGTWGLKVCISYGLGLNSRNSNWRYEYIEINNKTKNVKWIYRPAFVGVAEGGGKDIVWLSDWKIGDQLMESGDEVSVSVNMEESFHVKEFGIRIDQYYNEQEEESGIDLSAYQMSPGEYFLCNHDEFTRSRHYSMISGLQSVETCLCGFQFHGHSKHC